MTVPMNRNRGDFPQRDVTKLTDRDRDIFLGVANSGARPNKDLLAAAKEYKAWLKREKEAKE